MRRILSGIIIIILATLLTGCFNNNFEQNQIVSPEPLDMDIYGTWQMISNTVIDSTLSEKSQSTNNDYFSVTVSKDYVSFGDTYVENPKFKLKRVKKSSLIKNEFKSIENYELDDLDEFVDIIDIYDNNNVYFNFIKNDGIKSDGKYYIHIAGNLMTMEKVEENSPEAIALNINSRDAESLNNDLPGNNILSVDRNYYSMDSGVLLGLKSPTSISNDGTIKDATYRTLWISLESGVIQPIKEIKNILLVPRLNGFSSIYLESTEQYWGKDNRLIVINNKKGEEGSQSILEEQNVCKEINFVGSDYIGLGYYDQNAFQRGYEHFKIIPIDSINSSESMDLVSIFGESVKDNYTIAKKKTEELNNKNSEIYVDDYRNINLVRKNGQWVVEARAVSESNSKKYVDFSLNVSPINTLINYDGAILSWNKLKEFDSEIRDSVSSPNARMIITLSNDELSVYESVFGKLGTKLRSIPIEDNESIVMSEWATGDFVSYWETVVDENNGEIID